MQSVEKFTNFSVTSAAAIANKWNVNLVNLDFRLRLVYACFPRLRDLVDSDESFWHSVKGDHLLKLPAIGLRFNGGFYKHLVTLQIVT